uniref:WD repeat domain 60 n=1 Tax=Amphilophus citrinellus TaxID=61819 RepID=A0A3Q0SFI8_AMPCI
RKHRGGESIERRHRDPEKESRREKERIREGESTQERRDEEKKDRKKEGSQDRRADRERDRRDEREREKKRDKERLVDVSKYGNDYRENKETRRDREEKHDRERDKERQRDKGKERIRDSDRYNEDRNKSREYGDKERKREKQAREHRADRDRRRHEENWEGRRDQIEKHHREDKDRHREREGRKNEYEDRNGKAERRGDRKHSEQKEDRGKHTGVCLFRLDVCEMFKDYEEDFEELNESTNEDEDEEPLHPQAGEAKEELSAQQRKEIEEIQRAMDEENKRVGTAQSRQSTKREEEGRPKWSKGISRASQHGKFDIVAVKQPEVSKKVANKLKKRSTELLRLIDLDFSMTFSLLDLPPVNEYDMYIRNFGNANTKQAYVQCNEDNVDRDIQTEEIKMSEKWSQHPPKHSGACGGKKTIRRVMVVLLEEDQAAKKALQKLSPQSDMQSFSDGRLQLNTKLPFLYGRQIIMLHFSQVQKHTVMSVHMPTTEPSAMALDSCTIICIWNIWEPSRPQRILVYESEVKFTCCCFSPGKATMVFAGTSIGSVVLWDLREQASNHSRLKMGEEEWTFRQPTFSTGILLHSIVYIIKFNSFAILESSGLSFQLASLDETGVLNFWVGRATNNITSDLLSPPCASVRTVRGVKTGPLDTLLLKFLPTDSNHFFIGTNMGLVLHGTSHGLKAPPKFYRFQEVEVLPVDVTSIHFSPFRPHLFLVGCGNGTIRLHAVSHDQPVAQWNNSTSGEPVVSLQWAQTRPSVFCVLDAASNLHIWDLLKNDTQPVVTERMTNGFIFVLICVNMSFSLFQGDSHDKDEEAVSICDLLTGDMQQQVWVNGRI